jgi:hypothetical protein
MEDLYEKQILFHQEIIAVHKKYINELRNMLKFTEHETNDKYVNNLNQKSLKKTTKSDEMFNVDNVESLNLSQSYNDAQDMVWDRINKARSIYDEPTQKTMIEPVSKSIDTNQDKNKMKSSSNSTNTELKIILNSKKPDANGQVNNYHKDMVMPKNTTIYDAVMPKNTTIYDTVMPKNTTLDDNSIHENDENKYIINHPVVNKFSIYSSTKQLKIMSDIFKTAKMNITRLALLDNTLNDNLGTHIQTEADRLLNVYLG